MGVTRIDQFSTPWIERRVLDSSGSTTEYPEVSRIHTRLFERYRVLSSSLATFLHGLMLGVRWFGGGRRVINGKGLRHQRKRCDQSSDR
jgi:hypothetical protein